MVDCSICLDEIIQEEKYRTCCNHTYHIKCLSVWLNKSRNCPNCRTDLIEKFMVCIKTNNMVEFKKYCHVFSTTRSGPFISWIVYVHKNNCYNMLNYYITNNKGVIDINDVRNEKYRRTALHWACLLNLDSSITNLLLLYGADYNILDINGDCAKNYLFKNRKELYLDKLDKDILPIILNNYTLQALRVECEQRNIPTAVGLVMVRRKVLIEKLLENIIGRV
jgi:hypothetical protein